MTTRPPPTTAPTGSVQQMARLVWVMLLLVLGVVQGEYLRGAIDYGVTAGEHAHPSVLPAPASPAAPNSTKRELTGPLENKPDHVKATMPPAHPSVVDQVGTPPLVTLQGKCRFD